MTEKKEEIGTTWTKKVLKSCIFCILVFWWRRLFLQHLINKHFSMLHITNFGLIGRRFSRVFLLLRFSKYSVTLLLDKSCRPTLIQKWVCTWPYFYSICFISFKKQFCRLCFRTWQLTDQEKEPELMTETCQRFRFFPSTATLKSPVS